MIELLKTHDKEQIPQGEVNHMNTFFRSPKTNSLLILLLIVAVLVAACGGTAAQQPATQQPAQPQPTEAPDQQAPTPVADTSADREETTTDPVTDTQESGEATTDTSATPTAVADAAGGETESQPAAADEPLHTPYLEFGVVPHLFYTDHERALQLTKNAGFGWIRQQVVWKDMEMFEPENKYVWDQLDTIVEATDNYGLKLMISVVQAPEQYNPNHGLPQNPQDLGNFVEAIAQRYGDKIQAYEIWNEQNLAHETGGTIRPEDVGHYVEILMECYTRIKAVNPNVYVLAGAPSTTGFTKEDVALADLAYYRAMYAYKDGIIADYFDIQAVHPAGSANPPETFWPDNPSTAEGWTEDSTFYYRHIEHVREVMVEYGMDDHDIWITEFGWATENTTPGYEFGNQVTFEEQAEYITNAVRMTYEDYPWVGVMFLWNLNFAVTWKEHLEFLQQKDDITPEEQELLDLYWNEENPAQPLHEQASFGILNGDWSPRPVYLQLQQEIAAIKAEQGR
jgi:hypothetical protein